jgi:hypothetical protein
VGVPVHRAAQVLRGQPGRPAQLRQRGANHLPRGVLVYGDCAVNPDPAAERLADIAISSAGTAAQFGIEPRVAMLSYSTGTSGVGADVEKVPRGNRYRPRQAVNGRFIWLTLVEVSGAPDAHS